MRATQFKLYFTAPDGEGMGSVLLQDGQRSAGATNGLTIGEAHAALDAYAAVNPEAGVNAPRTRVAGVNPSPPNATESENATEVEGASPVPPPPSPPLAAKKKPRRRKPTPSNSDGMEGVPI